MSYENKIGKRKYWKEQRLSRKEKYKKQSRIEIRVSKQEKEYIIKQARNQKMTTTEFILENVLFGKITQIDFDNLKNLTYAVTKLGTNINQIARAINVMTKKEENMETELQGLLEELQKSKKVCDEVENLCSQEWKQLESILVSNSHFSFAYTDEEDETYDV